MVVMVVDSVVLDVVGGGVVVVVVVVVDIVVVELVVDELLELLELLVVVVVEEVEESELVLSVVTASGRGLVESVVDIATDAGDCVAQSASLRCRRYYQLAISSVSIVRLRNREEKSSTGAGQPALELRAATQSKRP